MDNYQIILYFESAMFTESLRSLIWYAYLFLIHQKIKKK